MSDAKTKAPSVHVILTGASGYLGQHLLSHWIAHGVLPSSATSATTTTTATFKITALYHKSEKFPKAVAKFRQELSSSSTSTSSVSEVVVKSMDLTDPKDSDILSLVQNDKRTIVVHAAANSSPRSCQQNPEAAGAINVPTKFLDGILNKTVMKRKDHGVSILALSTDQVYDGRQTPGSLYKEDEKDGLKPVNVYGQTKLELEEYLSARQNQLHEMKQQEPPQSTTTTGAYNARMVALRSSIILGPPAPIDPESAHGTFFDFCRSRGITKEATTFFTNEYRSVVRADSVIATIGGFVVASLGTKGVAGPAAKTPPRVVYNMGGPVRANRMELAKAVFDRFGYDPSLLVKAEQTSPMSPLDISMDSSLLFEEQMLLRNSHNNGGSETYLKELVEYVFGIE